MSRAAAVVAVCLFAATAVFAGPVFTSKAPEAFSAPAPSILGPTGAILTPNTATVGDSRWNVGYHFWTSKDGQTDIHTAKINVGLGPAAEVGVAFFNYDYPEYAGMDYRLDDDEVIWSFKLRVWDETETDPGVAIGVIDVGDQIDLTAYLVVEKTFLRDTSLPITLTAGYGSGEAELKDFFGSGVFHVASTVDIVTELDHEDFNYGLRWWPWTDVNIDVGAVADEFFAGIAYRGNF